MKKYIFTFVLSFVLISQVVFAQPKLEIVGGDTYDWGRITPKDDPLKAEITFRNSGNELLKILEVKPGCGCTTAPLDKNELNPGETAKMNVTFRTAGNVGNTMKSIRLVTNDPNAKNKLMYLKAFVFHPLQLSPMYFAFNDPKVGYETAAVVKLKNQSEQSVTLSDISIQPESVSLNLKGTRVLKPGEEIELIAKIKPDKPGQFNCRVKIKTNHPDYPELTINGFGRVEESVFNR